MERDSRRQLEPRTPIEALDEFAGALTGVYSDFDLDALRDEWPEARESDAQLKV